MKTRHKILSISLSMIALGLEAHALRWVPHTCYLTIRRRDLREDGPFLAWGKTKEEARERLLNLCRAEIEGVRPGECIEASNNPNKHYCVYSPRWEF